MAEVVVLPGFSGGGGADGIASGPGDDTIDAHDNRRDRVYCGGGTDTVYADAFDILRDCEIRSAEPLTRGGRLTPSAR